MRDLFPEFYERDDEAWQELWNAATFVLDANVLLRLSVLPPKSQDELFTVLEGLRDRLWVPYQVALEYQRNRRGKLTNTIAEFKGHCTAMAKGLEDATNALKWLELDKWALHDESAALEGQMAALKESIATLTGQLEARFDSFGNDAIIRQRLDRLVEGRIGSPPATADDMKVLTQDGDARFSAEIAPGYHDAEKQKSSEPTFRHRGLTYEKKFGDLILWRQLLAYVQKFAHSHVIFVTEDRKPDWWEKDGRDIVGPHPDLVHEMKTVGGVQDFHMYTLTQFLTRAKEQLNATVSDETLSDVEASADIILPGPKVTGSGHTTQRADISSALGALSSTGLALNVPPAKAWENALLPFLRANFSNCHPANSLLYSFTADGVPDFVASDGTGDVFFAVIDLNLFEQEEWRQRIAAKAGAMLAGRFDKNIRITILMLIHERTLASAASQAFRDVLGTLLPDGRIYLSALILVMQETAIQDIFVV
jgi:hypothetical protein